MYLIGFPLLVIPFAIYNMIVFLTPGVNWTDTITSVQAAHRQRCELSRQTMAALSLDDVVDGRGHRLVWALQLQVLREIAQHAGHADILREQILDRRVQ